MKHKANHLLRRIAAAVSLAIAASIPAAALDNPTAAAPASAGESFVVIAGDGNVGKPLPILLDEADFKGVWIAARN